MFFRQKKIAGKVLGAHKISTTRGVSREFSSLLLSWLIVFVMRGVMEEKKSSSLDQPKLVIRYYW
jgi:hypothetical protein